MVVCGDTLVLQLEKPVKLTTGTRASTEIWSCSTIGSNLTKLYKFPDGEPAGSIDYDPNQPNCLRANPDGKHVSYVYKRKVRSLQISQ